MPKYKHVFSNRFLTDLKESKKWYEEKQKGLGKKFYQEVKDSLQAISKTPQLQIRYDDVRCLPLKKYPFMIHYMFEKGQKTILFLACIHCS